ncbi:hypothetical protein GGR54DRAFT_583054 [Hypoxylon sp. NC1633]|nr:hypothetical protein GGR54DRAFT_583054 [Hypoxylon sp. NC1633]
MGLEWLVSSVPPQDYRVTFQLGFLFDWPSDACLASRCSRVSSAQTWSLEALLVIDIMVRSGIMLTVAQRDWREGWQITGKTFSQFASLPYRNGAEEPLDYGVRQFLSDFNDCIWSCRRVKLTK